jgi:hypothetical protein
VTVMSTTNKKLIVYVPTRPVPPLAEQSEPLALNVAPDGGAKTRLAAATISDPEHGGVVDWTAPQRAAVLTETCNRLSIQTIQAICMMPKMNTSTGSATKANSTIVAPRSQRQTRFISNNPNYDGVRDCHGLRP